MVCYIAIYDPIFCRGQDDICNLFLISLTYVTKGPSVLSPHGLKIYSSPKQHQINNLKTEDPFHECIYISTGLTVTLLFHILSLCTNNNVSECKVCLVSSSLSRRTKLGGGHRNCDRPCNPSVRSFRPLYWEIITQFISKLVYTHIMWVFGINLLMGRVGPNSTL